MNIVRKLKSKYSEVPLALKASLWFLICTFLQKSMIIFTTPIITRLLSTEQYGKLDIFYSWMNIISVFVTLNIFYGVFMQGMIKFDKEKAIFSSSLQGLVTTLVFLWTIIYLLFSSFFNEIFSLTTTQLLAMLVIIWSSSMFYFWTSEQRLNLAYKKFVVVTLLYTFIEPVVAILLILNFDDKTTARILSLALVSLILYSIPFIAKMNKVKVFFSSRFWKYALAFNLPLIPHYLSTSILSGADKIMIGSIIDNAAAGIYGLSYSLSMAMVIFNGTVMQTVEPWLYRKIKNGNVSEISDVTTPLFVFIAAVNLMLISFAPEVIYIFAPPEYSDAIWIIPPVAMSVFYMFAYQFFVAFQFYYEKKYYIVISTAIAAILNILLNFVFINIFGYHAAGYTTLICYMIYTASHYLFMRKITKDNLDNAQVYNTKKLILISIIFMALGFAFLMSYNNSIIRYSLILIYVITLITFHKKILNSLSVFKQIRMDK